MSDRRHAVLIASSQFPNEPMLQPLRCPENDVDGIHDVLASPVFGRFAETIVLKNVPHHEALLRINQTLKRADRDDLVLIYYSGHGKLDGAGRLHLATTDTVIDALEATSIPVESIRNYVDVSPTSRVVLILDCCFSGAVGTAFARGGVDDQLQRVSGGRGTYLMTASTGIQVALEKEDERYGMFTKHLIGGIKDGAADFDGDGRVTMDELYRYVHDRVLDEGFQEPMKWNLNVRGELVIAHTGRAPREERRRQIRELLLQLAGQSVLPDRILAKAMEVNAADAEKAGGAAAQYAALLDQLVEKHLAVGEFVDRWYAVIERPGTALTPPAPPQPVTPRARGADARGADVGGAAVPTMRAPTPQATPAPHNRVLTISALAYVGLLWLWTVLYSLRSKEAMIGFFAAGLCAAGAGAILGWVSRRARVWPGTIGGWVMNPLVAVGLVILRDSMGRVSKSDAQLVFVATTVIATILSAITLFVRRRQRASR